MSEPQAIVGEASLTEADLAQAVAELPGAKLWWLTPTIVVAAILLFWGSNASQGSSDSMLPVLLPLVFVVVLVVFFQRSTRRAWVKQAFANIGGPTTFRFDDYGFSSESSLRQHRLAWASLARSIEISQAFLVYTTPRTVLVVPKRAFAEAEVVTLRSMLAERVRPQSLATGGILGGSVKRMILLWAALIVAFLVIWQFLDGAPSSHSAQRLSPAEVGGAPASTRADAGEAKDADSSP